MMRFNRAELIFRGVGIIVLLLFMAGCASAPLQPPLNRTAAASLPTKHTETTTKTNIATKANIPADDTKKILISLPTSAESTTPSPQVSTTPAAPEKKKYNNLWDRIRAGFKLPGMEGPYVERQEQWFVNNPDYMERMLQRANLYLFYIVEAVEKRGIPMEIALLPAIESAYQPHAYSRARASGLWQFIPSTGRLYGLKTNPWYDGRRDVMASTEAALDYLEKLGKDFNGDWHLALAAYNCGEGKVMRMIEANQRKGLSTAYQDLKLPRETQQYVPKLMAMVNIVSDPAKYGLQLREIPNSTYFVQVDAGSQIDLGVVAKLTNVPLDDLYNMNPAFNRWATAPDGPHHLLIPAAAKEVLMEGLNDLPPESRMQWARHEVKRNDTLSRIAYRYGVSPDVIKTANNLQSNQLRLGQDLLIPVSGRKLVITKPNLAPDSKSIAKTTTGKVRIMHQVRAGDTLSGIARKYRVYVDQLRIWNLMDADDMLKAGQKLLIWISPASAAAEKNKETAG